MQKVMTDMTYIQGKSLAPGPVSYQLKTNDYMTDMTYIAPGPGLVCHHVLKYKRDLTNTRARQLQLLLHCYQVASSCYELLG
jgi:hypothetical protein